MSMGLGLRLGLNALVKHAQLKIDVRFVVWGWGSLDFWCLSEF